MFVLHLFGMFSEVLILTNERKKRQPLASSACTPWNCCSGVLTRLQHFCEERRLLKTVTSLHGKLSRRLAIGHALSQIQIFVEPRLCMTRVPRERSWTDTLYPGGHYLVTTMWRSQNLMAWMYGRKEVGQTNRTPISKITAITIVLSFEYLLLPSMICSRNQFSIPISW